MRGQRARTDSRTDSPAWLEMFLARQNDHWLIVQNLSVQCTANSKLFESSQWIQFDLYMVGWAIRVPGLIALARTCTHSVSPEWPLGGCVVMLRSGLGAPDNNHIHKQYWPDLLFNC